LSVCLVLSWRVLYTCGGGGHALAALTPGDHAKPPAPTSPCVFTYKCLSTNVIPPVFQLVSKQRPAPACDFITRVCVRALVVYLCLTCGLRNSQWRPPCDALLVAAHSEDW
jgi:hypothetical protein